MRKIDVVIPTYRPDQNLIELIQTLSGAYGAAVSRIIVINTEEALWREAYKGTDWENGIPTLDDAARGDREEGAARGDRPEVSLLHIRKEEFDHGATRDRGFRMSQAEFVLFMTQDCTVPTFDKNTEEIGETIDGTTGGMQNFLEALQKPFEEKDVAVSYARQLPADDCNDLERFTRSFNYPAESRIKTKEDIPTLGIKTYFCSNVCAMYRREIYEKLGGFVKKTPFNEDMIFAARAIQAGYKIAYVSDACVIHSHNFTGLQQYRRNLDMGISQGMHPEIFENVPSEGEGIRLVLKSLKHVFAIGKPYLAFKLVWQSACKYLGYRKGKKIGRRIR